MTTANIVVRKILPGRGNTAVSTTYTGIVGEITVDTDLDTLRVHDGVHPGGTRLATFDELANVALGNLDLSGYATTAQITAANANAAVQTVAINALNANIGAFQTYANATFTGGGVGTYSNANVIAYLTTVAGNIVPSANVTYSLGTATRQWKDLWVSNNTIYIGNVPLTVSNGTLLINGNAITSGSTYSNTNVAAYLVDNPQSGTYSNTNVAAYVAPFYTYANATYSTISNAATQATQINTINANVAAANGAITTANTGMKSYVDAVTTAWTANAAAAHSEIDGLRANIIASNATIASNYSTFLANAGAAHAEIDGLRANITAANAAIAGLQTGSGFATIQQLTANVSAANSAIVTANTGMKSYVDAVTTAWTANAGTQATDINALRANITAANSAITTLQTQVYSNTNTAAYLAGNVTTGNLTVAYNAVVLGNLQVNGIQTTVNTATLNVADLYITVANGAINSAAANGAGLRVAGALANIAYSSVSDSFEFNKPITVGNLIFSNNTRFFNNNVTLPNGQGFNWHFNDPMTSSDTTTLYFNGLTTGFDSWALITGNGSNSWILDSDSQEFYLFNGSGSDGKLVFGTASNASTGSANDIELKSTVGNVYITANSHPWTFREDGNLVLPTNMVFASSPAVSGTGIIFGDGTYQYTAYTGTATAIVANLDNNGHQVQLNSTGELVIENTIRTQPGQYLFIGSDTSTEMSWSNSVQAPNTGVYSGLGSDASGTTISYANTDNEGNWVSGGWNFGMGGVLTFPGGNMTMGNIQGSEGIWGSANVQIGTLSQGIGGASVLQWVDDFESATSVAAVAVNSLFAANTGAVQIITGNVGPTPEHMWTFDADGNLTLPPGGDILNNTGQSVLGGGGTYSNATVASYMLHFDGSIEFTSSTATIANVDTITVGDHIQSPAYQFANGMNILSKSTIVGNVGGDADNGTLWFNTEDGRTYARYSGQWVDASPTVAPLQSYYTGDLTFDGVKIIGADAGNGNGEMRLVPDNADTYLEAGQYIHIYPTRAIPDAPHIHLAAGYGGDLILGDDQRGVDINHDANVYVRTDQYGTARNWRFGTEGNLTLPTGGNINYANGRSILSGITAGGGASTGNVTFSGSDIIGTGTTVVLTANTTDWTFYSNANLVLPTNATIAYSNGVSILSGLGGGGSANTGNILFSDTTMYTTANLTMGGHGNVYVSTLDGDYVWTFDYNAGLTLPGHGSITDEGGNIVIAAPDNEGGTGGRITVYAGGGEGPDPGTNGGNVNITAGHDGGYLDDPTHYSSTYAGGRINLTTAQYNGGDVKNWAFDPFGNLLLPNGSRIDAGLDGYGIGLTTGRGTVLFGNTPEIGQPNHFHIMKLNPTSVDLYFGDDTDYLHLPNAGGVEIGTSGSTWTFDSNGNLSLPYGVGVIGSIEATDSVDLYGNSDTQYVQINWNNQNFVYVDSDGAHMQAGPTAPGEYEIFLATDGSTTFPDHKPVSITGNLTVGNLIVNGNTTTINTTSYSVTDNIIQMATDNPADTLDLGFVAHRTVSGNLQHTGLIRDASTGLWKLFSNVAAQPGTTVDFTNAIFDDLQLDKLYADTVHLTGTAPSTVYGAAGDLEGDIHVDADYLYYCTADYQPMSYTVGWEGSVGTVMFITKGDYPTPQVGWTLDKGGNGPWTIDTVTDNGSSWRIDSSGSNYGSPSGGTATLTNTGTPASIWKSVPLTAFQTAANATTRLTNGGSEVALQANGVTTFGNTATISNNGEFRIWADNDITVYRNGQDGYGVKSGSIETYTDNTQRTVINSNGLEIKTGNLIIPNNKAVVFANGVNILSTVGSYANADAAAYLAGNSALYLGNPVARYTLQANNTQTFVGNVTTLTSGGGASLGTTYLLNNIYFGANGAGYYRNTQTGAAQLSMSGSGGFIFSGTAGAVTANAYQGMGAWATLSSAGLVTSNGLGITSAGTLTIQGASGLVTTQAVGALFNTTASTINLGGAATTINMGASTVAVSVGSGTGTMTTGSLNATNLYTANAVIAGGYISGTANIAITSAGNISGVGNIIGATSNTTITAGSYTTSFLSNGVMTTGNIIQTASYYETYSNVSNTGGNITFNLASSSVFYAALTANVTANIVGIANSLSTVTGFTVIIDQGATPYRVANIQFNGGAVTNIKWAGTTVPTGTASNTDIVSISLINLGNGTYRVLGQQSSYG